MLEALLDYKEIIMTIGAVLAFPAAMLSGWNTWRRLQDDKLILTIRHTRRNGDNALGVRIVNNSKFDVSINEVGFYRFDKPKSKWPLPPDDCEITFPIRLQARATLDVILGVRALQQRYLYNYGLYAVEGGGVEVKSKDLRSWRLRLRDYQARNDRPLRGMPYW